MGVVEGKLAFNRTVTGLDQNTADLVTGSYSATYYSLNDNTIVFAIYGKPGYEADGSINVNHDDGYQPLKARAFKLSELVDMDFKEVDNLYVNVGGNGDISTDGIGYVLLNSKTAANKYVVAASMTVGESTTGIKYQETNALGYVVSAKQYYNAATSNYYAELVLINEDGRIEAKTIEDVKDLNNTSVLDADKVGAIDKADDTFAAGSFVRFHMNSDGVIDVLESAGGNKFDDVKTTVPAGSVTQNGLYLVNIVGERNGVVSFYDTDSAVNLKTEQSNSLDYHEDDGCQVIAIADDTYVGDNYTFVSRTVDNLVANEGNAVIQVEEGQIVRVFSFAEGYTLN